MFIFLRAAVFAGATLGIAAGASALSLANASRSEHVSPNSPGAVPTANVAASVQRATPALSLDEAVARALAAAPSIGAAEAAIAAARAGRVQAAIRPLDAVEVQAEDIAGTGNYNVLGQAEITGSYVRVLERGGKRQARIALAERDIEVAAARLSISRLEIAYAVEQAFAAVLIAEAELIAAEARAEIETALAREAQRRVKGYKDPLFVGSRASARVAEAEVGRTAARSAYDAARDELAAWWGGLGTDLRLSSNEFFEPVPRERLPSTIGETDLTLSRAELARAEAAIALERTRSIADYTVRGGLRYLRFTNDVAVVGGITIPLRAGRSNLGNIERAAAERRRIEFESEAARLVRLRRIAALGRQAEAARLEADGIAREVLPRLDKAFAQVREGYARGGFTFTDVQDQARALYEARARLVAALTRHHNARVELDRLTGRFATLPQREVR